MSIKWMWKRKEGPFLTKGRALHSLVGSVLALVGYFVAGDGGAAAGVASGALVGFFWEKVTHRIAPLARWDHPFGDLADALSFTIGAVIMGLIILGVF